MLELDRKVRIMPALQPQPPEASVPLSPKEQYQALPNTEHVILDWDDTTVEPDPKFVVPQMMHMPYWRSNPDVVDPNEFHKVKNDPEQYAEYSERLRAFSEKKYGNPEALALFATAFVNAVAHEHQRAEAAKYIGYGDDVESSGFWDMYNAMLPLLNVPLEDYLKPVDGVIDFLKLLHKTGRKAHFLTHSPEDKWKQEWEALLASHIPEDVIGEVVTRTDLDKVRVDGKKLRKPHPMAFSLITDKLGVPEESIAVFGNSKTDHIGAPRGSVKVVVNTRGINHVYREVFNEHPQVPALRVRNFHPVNRIYEGTHGKPKAK